MGGAAAGDVASKLACDQFLKVVRDPANQALVGCELLRHALEESNRAVYREASANPALEGMGTTVVALLLDSENQTACVAHAGDSRCYRWRKGRLEQLTSDHSYVEEQVRAGRMTPQEAEQSRMRNIITRALGSADGGNPDATQFDAASGDVFLLCTDGLTNEVPQIHIGEILSDEILDGETVSDAKAALTEACARLVEAALASGGHDNITAMLIEVP
jgi:protein phosphatase